jgi:hypothetical protein
MDKDIKKYNLKLKTILIDVVVMGIFILFGCHMFTASPEEKIEMLIVEIKYNLFRNGYVLGSVYICTIYFIPIMIYMLEMLVYKRKDVLILESEGITYYAPDHGKVFIPKDKIDDIYITAHNQMKIKLKNYEIKKSIRAKIWGIVKSMYFGYNPKNIFMIDLKLVKCDTNEIRKQLMDLNLDQGSSEANKLIKEMLERYNYKTVEELKNDENALAECVMQLYNMGNFTQIEIATLTKTSSSKVSKIIRKGLE